MDTSLKKFGNSIEYFARMIHMKIEFILEFYRQEIPRYPNEEEILKNTYKVADLVYEKYQFLKNNKLAS